MAWGSLLRPLLLVVMLLQAEGEQTKRGRASKESAAAAELKKLKAKRMAGLPELNAMVEVRQTAGGGSSSMDGTSGLSSMVGGRDGVLQVSGGEEDAMSEPSLGPSQQADRPDVQLLDLREGSMRTLRVRACVRQQAAGSQPLFAVELTVTVCHPSM